MSGRAATNAGSLQGWRATGLALIAGLSAALAHPPFGFLPGLLGFGLLMTLLDRSERSRPFRSAFWRGWLAGTAYFFVSTWWVGEAFLVDVQAHGWQAPFAVGFLAGGLGLLWGAAGVFYQALSPRDGRRVLLFAAVFALFEWLRGHILTGFPWDLPGEAWRAGGWISQSASIVGAYGLSFITLAIAGTVGLWGGPDSLRLKQVGSGLALSALVFMAIFGAWRLSAPSPETPSLRIRIVQGDINQTVKWSPEAFRAIFETHIALTAKPTASKQRRPDLVIWPESAIPADSDSYLAAGTWTRDEITAALQPGQVLIMGAARSEGSEPHARFFNSVLALRRDAGGLTLLGDYDKHHLVPFGEYMPFDAFMGMIGFKALVNVSEGFTPGPPPAPMRVEGVPPFQPLICYESLFPAFVANDRPRPAFIVNVSNDAWFGKTSGPWQHLNLASYRAIEEGLPLLRATPTGVSAVVDAFGRPLAQLGLGDKGVIDADLPPRAAPTLYRTLRDWPLWLILLVVVSTSTRLFSLRREAAA